MNDKRKGRTTMSTDELIDEAEKGLSGQGAIAELMKRSGEEAARQAKKTRMLIGISIVIAAASLIVSIIALGS